MLRSSLVRSTRLFSSTPSARKSLTDSVKETGDAVNKKVGKTLASGIEKGQEAAQSAKDTIGIKTENVKQDAHRAGATASHKAERAKEGASKAKQDFEKEIKK